MFLFCNALFIAFVLHAHLFPTGLVATTKHLLASELSHFFATFKVAFHSRWYLVDNFLLDNYRLLWNWLSLSHHWLTWGWNHHRLSRRRSHHHWLSGHRLPRSHHHRLSGHRLPRGHHHRLSRHRLSRSHHHRLSRHGLPRSHHHWWWLNHSWLLHHRRGHVWLCLHLLHHRLSLHCMHLNLLLSVCHSEKLYQVFQNLFILNQLKGI